MKRAIVVLLVAAAVLSTVFRLSAQKMSMELSAQEVLPEISGAPSVPRLAVPKIEFPHSTMPVGLTALKIVSMPKISLSAPEFLLSPPEIKLTRPFSLTPMERLAIANCASVAALNRGGEMTLLSWGNRTHGSTVLRSPQSPRLVAAALGLSGARQSYPGMGFSNSVAAWQTWTPTDGITLTGGVYASDNLFHTNRFKDLGVSGSVRVNVGERVTLTGFGSYSMYNNAGGPLPPMMYPQNHFGGSVRVRITDGFGLEGGVRRDFNLFTRRWENSYYVVPVFY